MWKYILPLSFIISFGLTWFVIPKILLISFKKRLFDVSNSRKIHKGAIPRLGGLAFMPVIVFAFALVKGYITLITKDPLYEQIFNNPFCSIGLCSILCLYFEGAADDLIGLRYRAKFAVQILCAILIVSSGLWINDFWGLFGIYKIPGLLGMPFSVLLIVFIINSINLIDGIDGLASGLCILASSFYGLFFAFREEWGFAILSFATLGTLIPFFVFNVYGSQEHGRKIFMGDTGSQTLGLIMAVFLIRLSANDPTIKHQIPDAVILAFSLLLIPIFDVLRVMILRLWKGRNPFEPDKSHIHHKFLALGFSSHKTLWIIIGISTFFVLLNLAIIKLICVACVTLILVIDLIIWIVLNVYLTKKIAKNKQSEIK